MIELKEIPEPIGNFILDQKDIKYIKGNDGAYWHYKDVITLLSRYKAISIEKLSKEYNELYDMAMAWKEESGN
jgi:hypothetical protein